MTSPMCHSFQEIGSWVWQRIELAQQVGLAFSEETITETVLLHLASRHPDKIKIRAFSKRKEAKNGSDWEWWVGQAGSWFGMRVQAKRIKLPSETFAPLQKYGRPKGSMVGQIDKLISQAKADKINPAYCLYFMSSKWPTLRAWPVYNLTGGGPVSPQGCLMADASAVKAIGKDTLAALAPVSVPWHLLVCSCARGSFNPGPGEAGRSMLNSSRQLAASILGTRFDDEPDFPPRPRLPVHMELLREGTDRLAAETFDPLGAYAQQRDLKGLVLIDTSQS